MTRVLLHIIASFISIGIFGTGVTTASYDFGLLICLFDFVLAFETGVVSRKTRSLLY